jgi:hypothetical protein
MKRFFVCIAFACAVLMVVESPARADMEGAQSLRSEKKSATCLNWVDVVITFSVPEGRRVEGVTPSWVDVSNVAELSAITVETSSGQLRISGRLRGPPPMPPVPGPSEATCNMELRNPDGTIRLVPMGVSNTGHGAIDAWFMIFKNAQ